MFKVQSSQFKVQGFKSFTRHLLLVTCHFFLLFAFCFHTANAQVDPPLRIEFESAKDQQEYRAVSLASQGVAVFYPSGLLSVDTAQWVILHYDTNLVRVAIHKIKIPNQSQYVTADFANDKLYMYFHKPTQKKDTLKNYLLEWDIAKYDFHLYDLQNHKSNLFTSMKVAGDYLFIVINEQKTKSIIHYNYKTNTKQTTQYIIDEITMIESFVVDTLNKSTSFCMFLKNKQGSRAELIVTDYAGNVKKRTAFPYHAELVYNSAKASAIGRDSLLIVGGFSHYKDKKRSGCYSGIYTLLYTQNRFSEVKPYSFGALLAKDSVFNAKYLGESNVTMDMHIKQSNGHIFAITEVFYPEYKYTTNTGYRHYGYYGYDPPTRVFAGYRFLNAYISEFDASGALAREWYFPIQNVLAQSFYNLVNAYQDKAGNSLFYYVYRNEVVSQFMHGQQVLAPQAATPIELSYKTDILDNSSNITMRHWYGNNFLIAGYQNIKNSQRGKGKRYVFFINKMICE